MNMLCILYFRIFWNSYTLVVLSPCQSLFDEAADIERKDEATDTNSEENVDVISRFFGRSSTNLQTQTAKTMRSCPFFNRFSTKLQIQTAKTVIFDVFPSVFGC